MASAGVNMPSGDGNPASVSSSAQECRLRRRRRLARALAATAAAGSDMDRAGPSVVKRGRSASPSSSSDEEEGSQGMMAEEEAAQGEGERALMPLAAAGLQRLPAEPQVWPVAYGEMSMTGRMREMEDCVSLQPGFCTWADGSPMHYFAVFDGHGGAHVSALCRDRMHLFLADELRVEATAFLHRRKQQKQAGAAGTSAAGGSPARAEREDEERAWRAALLRTFRRVDALACLACACGQFARPRCHCPLSGTAAGIVGSTAVIALLVRGRLVVANCGDSRAVLCRGHEGSPPVPLSSDHKPNRPDELARIRALGGRVLENNGQRVRGILAMSRALGDRFLKPEVISEPEITITDRTVDDECLILASDGMWDMISNETACAVARQCLEDGGAGAAAPVAAVAGPGPDPEPEPEPRCFRAATLLARLAVGRESLDNVSVIVIDLKHRG